MNDIYYKIYAQGISELKKVGVIYHEEQIEPYVYNLDSNIYKEVLVISHNVSRNEDEFYKKYFLSEDGMSLRRDRKIKVV